jgi:uncharacterized protein (DUF2141 family)
MLSTYTVNTVSDSATPGAGLLTLRQAVADANSNPGADTITFDPTVFTPGTLHTITLTQGQIEFFDGNGTTTVNGAGSSILAINGNKVSRVLEISIDAQVSISGLTITGGQQTEFDENGNTYGGAIDNAGTLTISNSVITGNSVNASVDVVDQPDQEIPGLGWGGGIYSTGSLTITGSTLSSNTVANTAPDLNDFQEGPEGNAYGGAIYATGALVLNGDTINSNTVTGHSSSLGGFEGGTAEGGGVYSTTAVSINGSTINGNTAKAGISEGGGDAGDAEGGGVFAGGALTITDSTISNNSALAGYTFGDENMGLSGGALGGGLYGGATVDLSGSTVSNNTATSISFEDTSPAAGGGIYAVGNTAVIGSTVDNNTLTGGATDSPSVPAAAGGGIYSGGTLSMQQSSISGNQVTDTISGYYQDGGKSIGGGIATQADSTITGSTISNNSVTGGGGYTSEERPNYTTHPGGAGLGGGVYASMFVNLTITSSTIYGNTAVGGAGGSANSGQGNGADGGDGAGGGIHSSDLTLVDSTVTGNTATGGAGGKVSFYGSYSPGKFGAAYAGGALADFATLTNSILSANKAGGAFSDFSGFIVSDSSGNNLVGVGHGFTPNSDNAFVNGVNGNIVGINNPQLSPIGSNGGPTHTLVPLPGSPAIDAGNSNLIPSGITTDQRGLSRIVGKAVDIGATEVQASIFGTVFNDTNGNGKQDSGDLGIPGVTVYIDSTNAGVFKSGDPQATTNSSGNYSFIGLVAGTYIVRQLLPGGDKQTLPTNGLGNHVTLSTGQTATGANFGDQKAGSGIIAGVVFNDITGNGKQDAGENGIGGVTVYIDLTNAGVFKVGDPIATTFNIDGVYSFTGLAAGTYIIRQMVPAGDKQTFPTNGFGDHVTLAAGQAVTGNNFGDQQIFSASIFGYVFNDANSNGKQDTGELFIPNVVLYIDLDNSGVFQSGDPEAATGTSGEYIFSGLAGGTYIVRQILPKGYTQTTPTNNFGIHVTVANHQGSGGNIFGDKV